MPEVSATMSSAALSEAVRGRPPAGPGEPPPEPLDDEEPLVPRPGPRCLSVGGSGTQLERAGVRSPARTVCLVLGVAMPQVSGSPSPAASGEVRRWRELCSDPNEFSEVKNSWLVAELIPDDGAWGENGRPNTVLNSPNTAEPLGTRN